MKKQTYSLLEQYMLSCMEDSAHDKEHIYRVLYNALLLAQGEPVDRDVLICACLLHDIGRKEQFSDSTLCHARVGSQKAKRFLLEHGFEEAFADHVAACIATHRFRKNCPPQTLEAKLLFDADKLDVVGAIGVARTLVYQGTMAQPLYNLLPDGTVSDGSTDTEESFFRECKFKLEKLYDGFYTEKARAMAAQRRESAECFCKELYRQVSSPYLQGKPLLELE